MKCEKCSKQINDDFKYCPSCGAKQVDVIARSYKNPYGVWRVSTEGDCEGRSVKQLGTHTGYVDDIAFKLAHQCFYKLRFCKIEDKEPIEGTEKIEIDIQFDTDSKTWDMNKLDLVNYAEEVFKDRNVEVKASNSFKTITLIKEV